MIEIGKTYVVCKGPYKDRYVVAMFLQQNGKFLCRFLKGTDPPTSFKPEQLMTTRDYKEYGKDKTD